MIVCSTILTWKIPWIEERVRGASKESDTTEPHKHEGVGLPGVILYWPESSFGFFGNILWKNPNALFDQLNLLWDSD